LQIGKDDNKKESKYQNIFIKLQMDTNIMAHQVKAPIQNVRIAKNVLIFKPDPD
jgi:hypothetical protein